MEEYREKTRGQQSPGRRPPEMAWSKNFGTKKIQAGSDKAREITRFIDDRRSRSAVTGRFVTARHARCAGDPRKETR